MDLSDYSEDNDYSNLCDKYSDILKESKGIPLQHDIKHYKDLLDPQNSPLKPC